MTSDTPAPAISAALIDYLAKLFPDRCPELGTSEPEVWFAAGRASVVRKLRSVHEDQSRLRLEA